MQFPLREAPEFVLIKVLEKLPNVARCRLRRTCKAMDNFAENHRSQFVKWSEDENSINIVVLHDTVCVFSTASTSGPSVHISSPGFQLSAICLSSIYVMSLEDAVFSNIMHEKLTSLMKELKFTSLNLTLIGVSRWEGKNASLMFVLLSNCNWKHFKSITYDDIPFYKILTLDTLKKSTRIKRKCKCEEIQEKRFLEQVKYYGTIGIEIGGSENHFFQNVLPPFVLKASTFDGLVPDFTVIHRENFAPNSIFPELHVAWSKVERKPQKKIVYVQKLNDKLLLIRSSEIRFVIFFTWRIVFVKNEKEIFKRNLEHLADEKISDELLNHLYERIVHVVQ